MARVGPQGAGRTTGIQYNAAARDCECSQAVEAADAGASLSEMFHLMSHPQKRMAERMKSWKLYSQSTSKDPINVP